MWESKYMEMALLLAKEGEGKVNPNPLVGAVIVKEDVIIGRGWHKEYGGPHAERNALADCSVSPKGATLYVNLEPCCHFGKTPPCTHAIVESGIARVIVGALDANPLVQGKGVAYLKEHGIEVVEGVVEQECRKLNEVFYHFIQKKTPFVVMKYAMTLDGKIATYTGASKWISGTAAREQVAESRNRYQGIMVGVETVLKDNPRLTCRKDGGRNPIRIICDTHLRTPLKSEVVETAKEIRTILATSNGDVREHQAYEKQGCEVLVLPKKGEHIDLRGLMQELGQRGIDSILLEGGATLNWSALESQIVQKVQCYIAPKLFGGASAKSPVGGEGVLLPCQGIGLKNMVVRKIGKDYLLEGEVDTGCLQES